MRHRIGVITALAILGVGAILIGSQPSGFAAQPRRTVRPGAATRPATQPTSRPAATRPAEAGKSELVAYYFHRTLRCPSCQHIEAVAKKTIQQRFASEIKVGRLRWADVDMQQQGNEHFATDYKLEAPSLVLVRMVNGQQVAWKNCEKVWDLHQNERKFAKYVQGEVDAMLKSTAKLPPTPARQ